jgi:hypothetical protein
MGGRYHNRFSPTMLLIILGFAVLFQACPSFDFVVCGQITRAEVTRVAEDTDIDPDGHFKHITSVHYRFTDIIPARRSCGIPACPFERDESANLGPGDPTPAVGDTIAIEYVANTPGVSRLWHYHDHHARLMLILMIVIFAVAAISIVRRNNDTSFHPKW